MMLNNCDDMRDSKGIEAGAAGLMKIFFPNKNPSEDEFYRYCVNPALELRQRVRDELCKLDREYVPITLTSKIPDDFQRSHRLASYVDLESGTGLQILEIPDEAYPQDDDEIEETIRFFEEIKEPPSSGRFR
jgi:ATP-dependent Lon protease